MATTTVSSPRGRVPRWLGWLLPVVAIGALVGLFLVFDPIGGLREVPPVEAAAVERTVLDEDEITLELRNDGPDPVTIAQVLVNEAYTSFEITDPTLDRLETATLRIPYPWEEGLPLGIAMVTSTGVTIEHEIEAAALTPEADGSTIAIYALLGVYIGVIPVAIGLFWYPSLRRASRRWIGFFLAFTVGLLGFLLIDTVAEGFELAAETPAVLDGLSLFALGAIGAVAGLAAFERFLGRRQRASQSVDEGASRIDGLVLAYLIAAGIGLHNLGEGLAVGAALAGGEIALGTFLILGFAIHNTTEGLAIVSPLGSETKRPSLRHFVALGAVAGAPTILGAWGGGFAFAPAWAALAFGIAAGAIGQVVWQIARGMSREHGLASGLGALGLMAGFVFMYATGLLTA
ncbi:MAG: ZIP family metal transporter [Actinomycetota bacterium]